MESLPLDHSAGTGPQPPSSIAATLSNNNNNSSSSSEMARKKPATKRSSNNMSTAVGGRDERLVFITLHFSDGTEVWQDGVNGPTPEMMDQTPDESGAQTYMREIPHNERKYVEWTRQLAEGMLAASTDDGWKEAFKSGKQFFFSSLPQGYRLYEQVRVPVC